MTPIVAGMSYVADPARYVDPIRAAAVVVLLPAISLGLWHNFGDDRPWDTQRGSGAALISVLPIWPTTTGRRAQGNDQLLGASSPDFAVPRTSW